MLEQRVPLVSELPSNDEGSPPHDELDVLYRVSTVLSGVGNVAQIASKVFGALAGSGLDIGAFALMLKLPNEDEFRTEVLFRRNPCAHAEGYVRGICESVFATGREVVDEAHGEAEGADLLAAPFQTYSFGVPLGSSGEQIGAMVVAGPVPETVFREADLRLLKMVATTISDTYARCQLTDYHQRSLEKQRKLMEIAAAINTRTDLRTVLRMVRDTVVAVGGYDRAGVFLYDAATSTIHGTWGTDREGNPEDIHGQESHLSPEVRGQWGLDRDEEYVLFEDYAEVLNGFDDPEMRGVKSHGVLHLRSNGETVGFIGVDNLLTQRPITHENLRELLPFAVEAASAIQKAQLLSDLEKSLVRQQRLMRMSSAIAANEDIADICRLVRDAIVESGVVDRASVFVRRDGEFVGTWGTDNEGRLLDESDMRLSVRDMPTLKALKESQDTTLFDFRDYEGPGGKWVENVPHGVVPLKVGEDILGLVYMDNLLSGRLMERESLAPIQAFTEQAAIALQKSMLLEDQRRTLRRQTRLMEMAAAISSKTDVNEVFRLVCEAMVETGAIERASMWLYESEGLRGTQGFDVHGAVTYEHHILRPFSTLTPAARRLIDEGVAYAINDEAATGFPHAVTALRAGGELLGLISMDNMDSRKPISDSDLQLMLPFAEQAAVAILNARLQKASQDELTRRRAVEQELREQAKELRDARDAALYATRVKSEFLANMSHEIRTPMNGVIGITALLLETPLNSEQLEYTHTIQSSAEALLRVIDDVLDFSKIEARKMAVELSDFHLRTCLEEVCEMMSARIEERDVEVSCLIPSEIPEHLVGDSARLRQILTNLLGNAVKFTERGDVTLIVTQLRRTFSQLDLRFEVRDTGIGIPRDRQSAIFDSFTQADGSTTRRYGGTGLGLSVTKGLVELLGGSLGMESEPGVGSLFWFELRFGRSDYPATDEEAPPILADLPVVIIDDHPVCGRVLEEQLRAWGCKPRTFATLDDALEFLKKGEPCGLLFVDNSLPDGNGEVALARLRESGRIDIPAVLLTPTGNRPTLQALRKWGFAASLVKPIRRSPLRSTLQDVVGTSVRRAAAPVRKDIQLRLRVLVAEDNPVNAMVAARRLALWGCDYEIATTGIAALDALARSRFDIVLMDVQMPEMDGFEATQKLRELEATTGEHLPVIAMTAHAMHGDRDRCLQAGMDDYLAKPINADDLLVILKRWSQTS